MSVVPSPAINLDDLAFVGRDLCRPECALCTRKGNIYVPDWRGGVMMIRTDGSQHLFGGGRPVGEGPILPNGIALRRDGSFLVASLGAASGVWSLSRDGDFRPFLQQVDGQELPATNFVLIDHWDRIWVTVSTRLVPRSRAFHPACGDGFVVLVDHRGARIVADGIGYTNEVHPSADGSFLYVNETYGRRLSRFPIRGDGTLGSREVVVEFGPGTFPDGIALDGEGCFWITSVISNRVLRVHPDGNTDLALEDADPDRLAFVEGEYQDRRMDQQHVTESRGRVLRNISSMAFVGPDLRRVVFGCLQGTQLPTFPSPVAGVSPAHWEWD